jgi:hypothetical protein
VADEQEPFADVVLLDDGFSLPELKWRELVFIGVLRPEGDFFVRVPGRALPPFRRAGLFPEGARFRVEVLQGRVIVRRVSSAPPS